MNVGNSARGRVLIVDQERAVVDRYSRWLNAAGFEVTEATGGAEALQRIENEHFDVVLSDISMPTSDGFALLRQMRARSLDVPVIVMLDGLNNRLAIEAMELGALQCLVKPIDQIALEKTAAYAVRGRRLLGGGIAAVRNGRGERVDPSSFTATEAKNEFGRVLELVIQGGVVVITKHQAPKAVLVSLDQFNKLAHTTERRLDTLSNEFDALLARMQTPKARAGMKAAFDASPKQLGRAAVLAARKRA
jgi:antitoxin Phd